MGSVIVDQRSVRDDPRHTSARLGLVAPAHLEALGREVYGVTIPHAMRTAMHRHLVPVVLGLGSVSRCTEVI